MLQVFLLSITIIFVIVNSLTFIDPFTVAAELQISHQYESLRTNISHRCVSARAGERTRVGTYMSIASDKAANTKGKGKKIVMLHNFS